MADSSSTSANVVEQIYEISPSSSDSYTVIVTLKLLVLLVVV